MEPYSAGTLMTSQEALVHVLVGAPFGDMEFDVGKSVHWVQWFADDVFITDVNLGDPRYWIVNWTGTFPTAYHTVTGINYFVRPVEFRKEQFAGAGREPGILLEDNDWVLFVDAAEGLCLDTRNPQPTDYLVEPFRSYVYREISRANTAGKDRVVLPFYAFLRHDNLITAEYPSKAYEDGTTGFTTAAGLMGTPYYLPCQGLTRLVKVSALRDPSFDWTLIDRPVPWEVKAGTGTPYATGYLTPSVGTASTPDTPNLLVNADMTWVAQVRIASLTNSNSRVISSQRPQSASNLAWHMGIANSNQLVLRLSINGTSNTSTANGGVLTGRCNPGDIITVAASLDLDNGASGHTITYWMLINSVWTNIGSSVVAGAVTAVFDSTTPLTIGNWSGGALGVYDDRIYWAEQRTGLNPAAGTVIWRFDANDQQPAPQQDFVDPRGRAWTLTAPTAITNPVAAVPAAPTVNLSIVSYGYAHWNLQDIVPPATAVEPLSEANDDGWRMRNLLSAVRPVPTLPYGSTYQTPAADPVGLAGPWAPADQNTPDPVQNQPVTPDPSLAHMLVGLYDNFLRLNMRDGVWYEGGALGNIPLAWNGTTWVPRNASPQDWHDTDNWVAPVA
jgi:hypothetical protein